MAEGYTGGGPGGDTMQYAGGGVARRQSGNKARQPILEKEKSVGYSATVSDQIFKISETASNSDSAENAPKVVEVENCGKVPIVIIAGYELYSSDTAVSALNYIHTIVNPGETISPPIRGVLRADNAIMDGTVATNATPNANLYVDGEANADDASGNSFIGHLTRTNVQLEEYTDASDLSLIHI